MTYHLNHILERLSKEKITNKVEDKDFQSLVEKYTSMQYINMFDILYDHLDQTDFKGLCFKLHGMNEEDVQSIIQDFINDGLINPMHNLKSVPSLSKLGHSLYYRVKSLYIKCSFRNEFINASVNENRVKLSFKNCPQTIAFLEKYPIPNLLDALNLEPNEVILELKYQSKAKALDVFNSFKDRIELFGNKL